MGHRRRRENSFTTQDSLERDMVNLRHDVGEDIRGAHLGAAAKRLNEDRSSLTAENVRTRCVAEKKW
jgi:hypothetical protein